MDIRDNVTHLFTPYLNGGSP